MERGCPGGVWGSIPFGDFRCRPVGRSCCGFVRSGGGSRCQAGGGKPGPAAAGGGLDAELETFEPDGGGGPGQGLGNRRIWSRAELRDLFGRPGAAARLVIRAESAGDGWAGSWIGRGQTEKLSTVFPFDSKAFR